MSVTHEPPEVIEVRHLLCEWDPLGLYAANGVSPDEYEGLIRPLLTRLGHGAGRDQVVQYLDHELHDHFGSYPDEALVHEFADRLLRWYGDRA